MTCTCTLCKLQCLGISEYQNISFRFHKLFQHVLTRVILQRTLSFWLSFTEWAFARRYFPGLNQTFLDLIAAYTIFKNTLPDISKTLLGTITDVIERPMDPVWVSLLPQHRVLGLVACPIASYCKLKQAQHQWNGRQFWRVLCSPSSNGSMLWPIKCFIAISSFCLGCSTQLWGTAGCNRSPAPIIS